MAEIVEGWTGPIDWLLKDGDGVAVDVSGATVALYMRRATGDLVSAALTIVDGPAGKVRWSPTAADLVDGPALVRVEVTSGGKKTYFPSAKTPYVLTVGKVTT